MITVSPVATRKELKEFTKFKIKLYAPVIPMPCRLCMQTSGKHYSKGIIRR